MRRGDVLVFVLAALVIVLLVMALRGALDRALARRAHRQYLETPRRQGLRAILELGALARVSAAFRARSDAVPCSAHAYLEPGLDGWWSVGVAVYVGDAPNVACTRYPTERWHPLLEREARAEVVRLDGAIRWRARECGECEECNGTRLVGTFVLGSLTECPRCSGAAVAVGAEQ